MVTLLQLTLLHFLGSRGHQATFRHRKLLLRPSLPACRQAGHQERAQAARLQALSIILQRPLPPATHLFHRAMSQNHQWQLFSQANPIRPQHQLIFPTDILRLLLVTLRRRLHIRRRRQIIPQLHRLTVRQVLATPLHRQVILLHRLLTAQHPPATRRLVLVTPLPRLHILLPLQVILLPRLPTVRHHQVTHQHLHRIVPHLQVTHQIVLATGNQSL